MSEFDPTKKSKDAEAMSTYLQTVSDVITGIDAMRTHWKLYAPRFPHERDERYKLRKELSQMTNVFRDVTEGLASKPFKREVDVTNKGAAISELVDDIDGRSNNLTVFSGDLFFSGIADSISWIRIEYPADGNQYSSRAEELNAGVRPYWVHVKHKDILEIRSERRGGGEVITYIRMWENGETIIELTPNEWVRWISTDDGWQESGRGEITIGIVPMVPFITGRRKGSSWQFSPPMKDALDAQVELFVRQSALKYAEIMACFPMLSANGVTPQKDESGKPMPLEVGPNAVLYAPPNAQGQSGSWSYVEPTTSSLKHLSEQIVKQMQEIREIGRQPLTAQSGNLTRISAAAAASKANSAVQQWALSLKDALENALMITGLWMNDATQYEVSVYADFSASDDDDTTPNILIQMRSAGDISRETLYAEMKRLGRLSDDFDPDQEQERLANELVNNLTPDGVKL